MTDLMRGYRNTNQQAIDRSFLVNEFFDVFAPEFSEHKNRLNHMLANYPRQHLDNILSNIFSANAQNFKRAVFELMLHEELFRLGFVVVVKPVSQQQYAPDFLVTTPAGESFYLEAATVDHERDKNSLKRQAESVIYSQCEAKITEKRARYKGQLDKPLVVALNVIQGGLSQSQERDLFFGGDDIAKSEDGIFTKNGRTGVRDDLAGVWYFDQLDVWHLPHARYCYIPNQYIKPQLLPTEFTTRNLLWMTDKGIEFFSGEGFLQSSVNESASPVTNTDMPASAPASTSATSDTSARDIVPSVKSLELEEVFVCAACLAGFYMMLKYFLF